jgi:hypothetical protein
MSTIRSLGGEPYNRQADHLWRKDGSYVGCFKGSLLFAATGHYIGELHGDRLGYNPRNAARASRPRPPLADRPPIAAVSMPKHIMPPGWSDFASPSAPPGGPD